MKISDVKGERSYTILKDVVPYINEFSKNEYFKAIFNVDDLPKDDKERRTAIASKIIDNLPDLISSCKDGLTGYFALLEGITPEEYAAGVTAQKVFDGIIDMFNDDHFKIFFTRFLKSSMTDKG